MTAKRVEVKGPVPPPELGGKELAELLESGEVKVEVDPKFPQAIGISNILQHVATFGNFRWDVLLNDNSDCPFFTSDFPVGNEPTSDERVLNRVVPLTPTLAIRIQPDITLDRTLANFEFTKFSSHRHKVGRQEAVKINRLLVQSAEDTVFFRDNQSWVAGFVKKNRHFRVETFEVPQAPGTPPRLRTAVRPFQRESTAAKSPA
jgi:Protein of unknown function (DUF4238)